MLIKEANKSDVPSYSKSDLFASFISMRITCKQFYNEISLHISAQVKQVYYHFPYFGISLKDLSRKHFGNFYNITSLFQRRITYLSSRYDLERMSIFLI